MNTHSKNLTQDAGLVSKIKNSVIRYLHILWDGKNFIAAPFFLFIALIIAFLCLSFIYSRYQIAQTSYIEKSDLHNKKQETAFQLSTPVHESIRKIYERKQFNRPIKNSEGQKVIEKIRRQLHLESMKVNTISDSLTDKDLKIYTKKFSINVKSHTDRKIYQLIDRLHHQMPGLIIFKDFSIKRNPQKKGNVSKDINSYLFEGVIECLWMRQKSS